jgi:hypothetical protein
MVMMAATWWTRPRNTPLTGKQGSLGRIQVARGWGQWLVWSPTVRLCRPQRSSFPPANQSFVAIGLVSLSVSARETPAAAEFEVFPPPNR